MEHPESEIFATSFNSEFDVRTKYPEALPCLEALSRHDHASLHVGIEATALSTTDFGLEFDLILFNHFHSGSGLIPSLEGDRYLGGNPPSNRTTRDWVREILYLIGSFLSRSTGFKKL